MSIEKEIFERTHVNIEKLESYGFKKIGCQYFYCTYFLDDSFKAEITVDEGMVSGRVIDLEMNEEYSNIRVSSQIGPFVSKVREEYKNILINIKENCFESDYFLSEQANRITKYIYDTYHDQPEFLWEKFKGYGVFRNKNTNKWYGAIMNINKSKLDKGDEEVEVLNIKLDSDKVSKLLKRKGFYLAYHMNKKDWITIILDNTLEDDEIIHLLDESYGIINEPVNWIVPANPKYYDIVNCFHDSDEIIWKQSSDVHVGDIVYIYVASPYSKIMYQCKAVEVNIDYEYKSDEVFMSHVMRLKLIKYFKNQKYTFEYLNGLGIHAIRGPRKISKDIANKFK